MKNWLIGIGVFLIAFALLSAWLIKKNDLQTNVSFVELEFYERWNGVTYINGNRVNSEDNVAIIGENDIWASIAGLQKYISGGFIYQDGMNWYIRLNRLPTLKVFCHEDGWFIPISSFSDYIHVDEGYYARGILFMHTYLPANISWNGTAYTITNEATAMPTTHYHDTTEDGRKMWCIERELWIESDDGLMYRYEKPPYSVN